MVSKSGQLEQLFVKWEYAQENEPDVSWERTRGGKNITKSHFRRDGMIDEIVFSKENGINEMSDSDAAIHYAVMDLNKRGGGAVKDAVHIQEYCKYYGEFIKREIEIINPDVVVWLGTKTYDMNLHINYLGARQIGDKIYFLIDGKQIPILRM